MKRIPNNLPELNFQEKEKLFRLYLIHTPWISGDHESFKEIRRSIRQSIFEKTSSEEFIPILIKKYRDDFGNSALNLPMAIRSIKSEEKFDILEDYALNNDHEIQDRRAAIWLLACLNKGGVESILIKLLKIKDQSLKQMVIWALGIQGSKESTRHLIDIIKEDYAKKLKLESVRALKQFSDKDVALDLALATRDVQDNEIKESMFNTVRKIR